MPVGIMMCLARVLDCAVDGVQDYAGAGTMKLLTVLWAGPQSQGWQGNPPGLEI